MIDYALQWVIARIWRRRITRREGDFAKWDAAFMAWKRENPDRCMYCMYTHWVNVEKGQKMKLKAHHCVEGKSPPHPLPRAKVTA